MARLPHPAMSHQRRERLRVPSTNAHRQSGEPQTLIRGHSPRARTAEVVADDDRDHQAGGLDGSVVGAVRRGGGGVNPVGRSGGVISEVGPAGGVVGSGDRVVDVLGTGCPCG